jgi:hypothetical protein
VDESYPGGDLSNKMDDTNALMESSDEEPRGKGSDFELSESEMEFTARSDHLIPQPSKP